MSKVRRRKIKKSLTSKFKEVFFSSTVFPFILTFTAFGVLFVLFRMKGVEIDYKISSLNKKIERVTLEGKELKAKKARLLSMNRLRGLAKKYKLQQPKQKQIIVVP